MRIAWQVAGGALLVLAGLVAWEGVALRYWTSLGPGAGFFPLWLAGLLAVLSAGMIAQARFGTPAPAAEQEPLTRAGGMRVAGVVGALVAVAVLLEPLGFRLTMTGLLFGLLLLLGRQRPAVAAGVAVLGGFGGHALFAGALGVPLPIGVLGF